MGGKLKDPKVITDYNHNPVIILPRGFYFNDERWEAIWEEYDIKGESLTMDDLRRMFPSDESLHAKKVVRSGSQLAEEFKKPKIDED